MKKTIASIAAAAMLVATAVPVQTPVATAQGMDHKPGQVGNGVWLPANTPDTTTNAKHTCADRKLLYHSHVDAIYGTRKAGKLTTMVVDGQVVVPANQVCVRLAPDADPDGKEASRFVVPADQNGFEFLGEPGTILWYAPQMADFTDSWRPVWAGQGSFDREHEYNVPTDFVDNKVTFELSDFSGPGDVDMFFFNGTTEVPRRTFSTREDSLKTFKSKVGSHGHYNWTFTKPGQYDFTWTIKAEKTDGTTEVSEPVTTTWLVGSDEDVNLPAGTTTDLRPVTKSAEEIRDEMLGGSPSASEEATSEPTSETKPGGPPQPSIEKPEKPENPEPSTESPKPNEPERPAHPAPSGEKALVTEGHSDMSFEGDATHPVVVMNDDAVPAKSERRESGTFAYAVPDSAKLDIPAKISSQLGIGNSAWVLPQSQQEGLPWPGFSTQHFDYSSLDGSGVTLKISDFQGPGRMITAHESMYGLKKLLDSDDLSMNLKYPDRAHDHQAIFFTKPGNYTVTFTYEAKDKSGAPVTASIVSTFLVGDSAVQGKGEDSHDGDTTPGADHGTDGTPGTAETGTSPTGTAPTGTEGTPSAPTPGNNSKPDAGKGTKPTSKNRMDPKTEKIAWAIAGSTIGLAVAKELYVRFGPKPKGEKSTSDSQEKKPSNNSTAGGNQGQAAKTAPTNQGPAPAPAAAPAPAPAAAPALRASSPSGLGASLGSSVGSSSGGSSSGSSSSKSSSAQSSGTKPSTTSTPTPSNKPAPKGTILDANSQALGAPGGNSQPVQVQPQNLAQTNPLTGGGWAAGFILGIGLMALLGGLGLFAATAKTLRRMQTQDRFED